MPLVISASRRTDLAGCYPDAFIERLAAYPPDKVHTLVIWTKNPLPLLENKTLLKTIRQYARIYIYLSVTGMGGGIFEPGIPEPGTVLETLPELIELVSSPDRIVWRFDPIVHFKSGKKEYTNLSLFKPLSRKFAGHGISLVKTSWVSPYKKVIRNLSRIGWEIEAVSSGQKKKEAYHLERIARSNRQRIEYCCVEGFSVSRCIDGPRLNELHPDGLRCSVQRAKNQRVLCGCTESIDIGWYTQACLHGCVYCYANPKI